MNNYYVLKDYSKDKKVVVCKICSKQKKVKNKDLKTYTCCNDEKWELEKVYNDYRKGAIKRNLSFDLTKYEFERLVNSICFYCNSSPTKMKSGIIRNGIDRINNEIGYNRKNTISCCSTCNFMKRDLSFKEFKQKINNIYYKLEEIETTKTLDEGFAMLYRSGYVDIDVQMLIILHHKKLITLDKNELNNYVESIIDKDTVISYINRVGKMIKIGYKYKGSDIKELKFILQKLLELTVQFIDEGSLKIETSNNRNNSTMHTVPLSRGIGVTMFKGNISEFLLMLFILTFTVTITCVSFTSSIIVGFVILLFTVAPAFLSSVVLLGYLKQFINKLRGIDE